MNTPNSIARKFSVGDLPRGQVALRELLAEALRAQQTDFNKILSDMAIQLEEWARESKDGWSTHQVEPMRRKADELRSHIIL